MDQLVLLRSLQGQGGPHLLRCLLGHPFPIAAFHAFDDSPEAYALRAIIQRLQDDLAVGFRFPPPSVDQGPDPEIRTLVTTPLRLHRSAKGVKFGREFGPKEHVTVPFRNGDCSCRFPLGNFGQLAFTPSIPPILSHCPDDISPLPPCLSPGKITPIPLLLLPLTRVAGLIPFVCPRFSTPPLIFLPRPVLSQQSLSRGPALIFLRALAGPCTFGDLGPEEFLGVTGGGLVLLGGGSCPSFSSSPLPSSPFQIPQGGGFDFQGDRGRGRDSFQGGQGS